jgi:hypothetical protein
MTLSRASRDQNFNDALMRMAQDVGDGPLYDCDFETHDERYRDILPTTWDLLMESGYVKFRWFDSYNLTIDGWAEGVLLLGSHNEPPLSPRLSRLMAVLNDEMKGRKDYEIYLPVSAAAASTGIPEELIRNIIKARLIERVFDRVGVTLDADDVIVIPRRFGHPL